MFLLKCSANIKYFRQCWKEAILANRRSELPPLRILSPKVNVNIVQKVYNKIFNNTTINITTNGECWTNQMNSIQCPEGSQQPKQFDNLNKGFRIRNYSHIGSSRNNESQASRTIFSVNNKTRGINYVLMFQTKEHAICQCLKESA